MSRNLRLLLSFLAVLLVLTTIDANASDAVVVSQLYEEYALGPLADGFEFFQTFTIPTGVTYIDKVTVKLAKYGPLAGDITLQIYKLSDNTSALEGSVLAQSTVSDGALPAEAYANSYPEVTFSFESLPVHSGELYSFRLTYASTSFSSWIQFRQSIDRYPGGMFWFASQQPFPGIDLYFKIWGGAACQVSPTQTFHQFDNQPSFLYAAVETYPSLTGAISVPQYFGYLPSPNSSNYVLCATIESGCALTSTATMLTSFSALSSVTPTLLDCELRGDSRCAGTNNYYGKGTSLLCPVSQPGCPKPKAVVSYHDWCEFGPAWSGVESLYPNVLQWTDGSQVRANQQQPQLFDRYQNGWVSVDQYLSDNVCNNQGRVILQLNEYDDSMFAGLHYVFVTGQSADGNDWNLFDPGWRNAPATLGDHEIGFRTCPSCPFRQFTVSGARSYTGIAAATNNGSLTAVANSPIEVLITDPAGRRLGYLDGNDVFEISGGSYVRDFPAADDFGIGPSNGDPTGVKTAHIASPAAGSYQFAAIGTGLGTYELSVRSLAVDGTTQITTTMGVASLGSTSKYQASYSSDPGGLGAVTVKSTFDSTLADIKNCLALGLIDNDGIANALTSKIAAALAAASAGDRATARGALGAFINQVNAQSGKHILGVAPQILLSDAASLLTQVP